MADDILEYWMSIARELAARFNIEEFDTSSAFWNWENFGEDIKTIRDRLGVNGKHVNILGIRVNLGTGEALDTLADAKVSINRLVPFLYYYSKAKDEGVTNEWVKFNALSGSWACRFSFDEEDIKVMTTAFLENRAELFQGLERLGAKRVDYGDAGFEVPFLPRVRVLLIFEDEDEEFPASIRLLYDRNSIFYQPHEMLGVISSFLASRALKAV
ncbi:MAG: DUF3786 domain-containing protein [Candidatus Thorarchaeota archaeon]